MMRKAIYLNVLTHVQGVKASVPDSQLALREVGQMVREAASKTTTANKLTVEVERVRLEHGPDTNGVHVGLLTYLEGEQDAPASFTKLAIGELEKFLSDVFKQPTPAGLKVTIHTIEENNNAVDELADEADQATKPDTGTL